MKKKIIYATLFVVIVLAAAYTVWNATYYSVTHVPPPSGHTWSEYKNKEPGFAISYPSDIAHPYEVTDPPSPDGIFPGADEVRFYDVQNHRTYISLWVQETNAKDADGWFKEAYGPDGKGWYVSGRSKVGGVNGYPAISVSEGSPREPVVDENGLITPIPTTSVSIAPDALDLTFVHSGKAWTLILDRERLSSLDVQYIAQSFRFLHWWEKI